MKDCDQNFPELDTVRSLGKKNNDDERDRK